MDGFITKEDIRLLFSYIPFKRSPLDDEEQKIEASSSISQGHGTNEGLFDTDQGRNLNFRDRLND